MIVEALAAAVRFLPRAWSRPWFLALLAGFAVLGGLSAFVRATWAPSALSVAMVLYMPLLQAPLLAVAMRTPPADGGFLGDVKRYIRVVAVNLLTDIFLFVPAMLLFVIGLAVVYALAWSRPGFDPKDISTWTASGPVLLGAEGVAVLGVLALAWLFARVSLGPAVTVREARVQMISTWPLTRGRGWRIVAGRLLLAAPVIAVLLGANALASRIAPDGRFAGLALTTAIVVVLGVWVPLQVGLTAYFYDHRAPPPDGAR